MKLVLMGLGSYPSDYKYMADINHWGPDVLGGVLPPASFAPLSVRNQLNENALIMDTRQFIHIGVNRINGFLAGALKLGNRLVYPQSPPKEST